MKTTDRVSKLDLGSVRDWDQFSRNWINELYEVPFTETLFHWAAVTGRQLYGHLPDGFDAHGSTLPRLEIEDERGDHLALAVVRATRGITRPPKLPPRVGFCISPGGI